MAAHFDKSRPQPVQVGLRVFAHVFVLHEHGEKTKRRASGEFGHFGDLGKGKPQGLMGEGSENTKGPVEGLDANFHGCLLDSSSNFNLLLVYT
jgi:hypothetical protein